MRILMASHGYPPTVSGVSIVVQKLARAMVRRGHTVAVVTGSDQMQGYRSEDQGVELIRVHSRDNPFWKEGPLPYLSLNELCAISDAFKPDVLHVHEVATVGRQFQRLSLRSGAPLLASCHFVPRFAAHYLGGDVAEGLVESAVWTYSIWLLNRCDHVVFATEAHRRYFAERGLQPPTTIISNGIDTARYSAEQNHDADVVERYSLPARARILFVGRMARDKEIDVLIRAMPRIAERSDAHLLLVGRGDERSSLEVLAHEEGVAGRVHFLGFVPEDDMPALFRAVDLFAITSTCEVQSLPTLEAMATRLPVVAADAVALPEIVKHGGNGFLVPPREPEAVADAIVRILSDRGMAARMGEAGYAIARQHDESRTFDRYEQLYRRLLGEGAPEREGVREA
ncbi:MAG: glycosyltransferase [Anaerolineae bacterium]